MGLTGGLPTSAPSEMVEENDHTDELEDELLSDDYESDIEDTDGVEDVTGHAVQNNDGEDVVVDDEEVVVGVDSKGELVARGSRVADYTMRGPALQDISLWEYVARVKKERITKLKQFSGYDDSDDSGSETDDEGNGKGHSNLPLESIVDGDWSIV